MDNEKTDIINVVYPCGLRNAHAQWKLDLISRCNGETVKTWKVEFTTEKCEITWNEKLVSRSKSLC